MRQVPACLACYLRQVQATLEAAGADEETAYRVMEGIFPLILTLDRSKSPAENTTLVLLRTYEVLGQDDPYRAARAESNRRAWRWLGELEKMAGAARDPLLFAIKVAAAGNIIDLGLVSTYDLGPGLAEIDQLSFARLDYADFKAALAKARQVLVIGDNSGEIVLDRLLLRQLGQGGRRVIYAVKGGPISNDATWEDAAAARLAELAEIIDTGSNYLGVVEEHCGAALRRAMQDSDLIIAKGQANYETLEGQSLAGDKTFFLLRAKCAVVAQHLGVPQMAPVLARNRVSAAFN